MVDNVHTIGYITTKNQKTELHHNENCTQRQVPSWKKETKRERKFTTTKSVQKMDISHLCTIS